MIGGGGGSGRVGGVSSDDESASPLEVGGLKFTTSDGTQ